MISHPGELIPWFSPLGDGALPIDPWAANPLVDGYQRVKPELVAMADAEGPRPTFFNTGDLPPFTGSGLDPRTLQQIPWQARHAAAQMASVAEVFTVVQQLGGDAGAYLKSDGLDDYLERVANWITGNAAASRGPAASVPDDSTTLDDALYELLFKASDDAESRRHAPSVVEQQAMKQRQNQRLKRGYYLDENNNRVLMGPR